MKYIANYLTCVIDGRMFISDSIICEDTPGCFGTYRLELEKMDNSIYIYKKTMQGLVKHDGIYRINVLYYGRSSDRIFIEMPRGILFDRKLLQIVAKDKVLTISYVANLDKENIPTQKR